jgi:amidohydrolase
VPRPFLILKAIDIMTVSSKIKNKRSPRNLIACVLLAVPTFPLLANASDLSAAVNKDYKTHLAPLFDYFHRNPELSFVETKTAARLAKELRDVGFDVTEGIGKTGVVAILKNGTGPLVMLRADMDGLPVQEKSGLPNASTVMQKDKDGVLMPVMHACGHDIHVTSMIGTARQMIANRSNWSGTLMLVGQPAEEIVAGARAMMDDKIWSRFGRPDFALTFHVSSEIEAGKIDAVEGSPYSGVDTVEILIHGQGAHGASPHRGKDPIVLGSQIVVALQTIISREKAPRDPGVITVGSFHAGTKSNIIGDNAKLQITVRSESAQTRDMLLKAISRVALNTARAAGVPENQLPEITMIGDPAPPTLNDIALTKRLKKTWADKLGMKIFEENYQRLGMGAEDFPQFTTSPPIPSVYFSVGGTPKADFDAEKAGGPAVPSHHSPLFKVSSEPAILTGVETTVIALMDLLKKK